MYIIAYVMDAGILTEITNISAIGLKANLLNGSKRSLLVAFFLLHPLLLLLLLLLLFLSLLDFVIVQYVHMVECVLDTSEYTQLNGIRKCCAPFVADIKVRLLLDTDTVQSSVRFTPFDLYLSSLSQLQFFN